jgi:hypothetical protein
MALLIALGLAGTLIQSPVASLRAAVSGRVLEDGNRAPIAGARLTLFPARAGSGPVPFRDRPLTAITDRDGRYEFDDLEAGRYRITAQKAGFALPNDREATEVSLEAGERRENVNVTLQKGAVIVGRVLDEAGEPLVEARVMAMRKPGPPSAIRSDVLFPVGPDAQTNDLGEFRLFSLPAGEYYVQAMPRHDFDRPHARATTLLPTYFPGTSDPAAAQPISVAAGQTWGDVVIRMIGAPAFHVSGVLLDEAGRPVVNALVKLIADESTARPRFMMGPWGQTRTDASGKFSIDNVTNGTYTLLAIAPVVISGPADGRAGGANGGGSFTSFGWSGGVVGGSIGAGVMTETSNGITTQYRDDTATRVPITVSETNVGGLEVLVRPAAR